MYTISVFKMHEICSVDSQENCKNCCHQLSDFKAKMHHIRSRLGLRPRPRWGSLQRFPRPLSWIKAGLFLREGRERVGKRGKGGREGILLSPPTFPPKSTPLNASYIYMTAGIPILAPMTISSSQKCCISACVTVLASPSN